jgi:hypothetical protein
MVFCKRLSDSNGLTLRYDAKILVLQESTILKTFPSSPDICEKDLGWVLMALERSGLLGGHMALSDLGFCRKSLTHFIKCSFGSHCLSDFS